MAKKTSSSKRADNETRKALKTLRTDLKRLGRAISKDLKARTGKNSGGKSVATAAKQTKTSAKKAADKSSTSAKKPKADSKK